MANLLENILACLFGDADDHIGHVMEKQSFPGPRNTTQSGTPDEIATDVVNILRTAEKNGHQLERDLNDTVKATAGGWTEGIAKAVLNKLVDLLSSESRDKLGPAIKETLERAEEVADGIFDFAHDHPVAVAVFCTILAIGVLWFMAPWVLEVLGFAAEGPVEESFASWWQATYAGYVPKGSLFSFFQRLAMKWPRVQLASGHAD